MTLLEREIERTFMRLLADEDVLVRKMNGLGYAGWPDRMILGPTGRVCFVELKRPGGSPTPLQARMLAQLHLRGFPAEVFDDARAALEWVRSCVL